MSELDDTLNNAESWCPRMPPPASFSRLDAAAFQKRIDSITGTRDERSLIKLAWAPDELRWYPHRMTEDPIGYTLPIFVYGNDANGEKVAAPRWVLLERLEPEQYASTWEMGRYSVYDGTVWDWKGPCPSERYIELRAHSYHDGECCPCSGDACVCGEQYAHCWGKYLDPNERLLDWIRKVAYEARNDPDVQPTRDIRFFTAPQAQRDAVNAQEQRADRQVAEVDDFTRQMAEFWARKPVSTGGLRRTDSGLYLLT
jgi:hypothetical protein